MLQQANRPQKFQPLDTQGSVMYIGDKRAAVYLQNGCLFSESHEDLFHAYRNDPDRKMYKNILIWLDHNGYTMNIEMRHQIVAAINLKKQEARMEAERQRMLEQQRLDLEKMELELARDRRLRSAKDRAPIPQHVSPEPREELKLTPMEEAVLGDMFQDEDEDTGLPPLAATYDSDDYEDEPDPLASLDDDDPPPPPAQVKPAKPAAPKKK